MQPSPPSTCARGEPRHEGPPRPPPGGPGAVLPSSACPHPGLPPAPLLALSPLSPHLYTHLQDPCPSVGSPWPPGWAQASPAHRSSLGESRPCPPPGITLGGPCPPCPITHSVPSGLCVAVASSTLSPRLQVPLSLGATAGGGRGRCRHRRADSPVPLLPAAHRGQGLDGAPLPLPPSVRSGVNVGPMPSLTSSPSRTFPAQPHLQGWGPKDYSHSLCPGLGPLCPVWELKVEASWPRRPLLHGPGEGGRCEGPAANLLCGLL